MCMVVPADERRAAGQPVPVRAPAAQQPALHLRQPGLVPLRLADQRGGAQLPHHPGRAPQLPVRGELRAAPPLRPRRLHQRRGPRLRRGRLRRLPQPRRPARVPDLRPPRAPRARPRLGHGDHAAAPRHGRHAPPPHPRGNTSHQSQTVTVLGKLPYWQLPFVPK
jgi:hypothetical protein